MFLPSRQNQWVQGDGEWKRVELLKKHKLAGEFVTSNPIPLAADKF